jgi:hypothetical protein
MQGRAGAAAPLGLQPMDLSIYPSFYEALVPGIEVVGYRVLFFASVTSTCSSAWFSVSPCLKRFPRLSCLGDRKSLGLLSAGKRVRHWGIQDQPRLFSESSDHARREFPVNVVAPILSATTDFGEACPTVEGCRLTLSQMEATFSVSSGSAFQSRHEEDTQILRLPVWNFYL